MQNTDNSGVSWVLVNPTGTEAATTTTTCKSDVDYHYYAKKQQLLVCIIESVKGDCPHLLDRRTTPRIARREQHAPWVRK